MGFLSPGLGGSRATGELWASNPHTASALVPLHFTPTSGPAWHQIESLPASPASITTEGAARRRAFS